MERKVLGRGLRALISEGDESTSTTAGVNQISISEISANPDQPRTHFDEERLGELAQSIADMGIMQPLVVRRSAEGYQLIAGERRLRAAKQAGLTEVPVVVRDVRSPEEALQLSLIENIQREDLNPLEEARAYSQLCEDFGMSQDDVAKAVGKDRSTVANTLRLLKLPPDAQAALEDGRIAAGHARAILSIKDDRKQRAALRALLAGSLSVRQTEIMAQRQRRGRRGGAADDMPEVTALENALAKHFGTKVKVAAKGKGGQVSFQFHSSEDLARLLQLWQVPTDLTELEFIIQ